MVAKRDREVFHINYQVPERKLIVAKAIKRVQILSLSDNFEIVNLFLFVMLRLVEPRA